MTQIHLSETESNVKINALAKNSIVIITLKIVEIILAYLVQFFLVRWMGTEEYGIYEYVISWSLVLAIPVSFGLPRAVLRPAVGIPRPSGMGRIMGLAIE
ncbi:MAG: oligosaccharide flippase family protein [Dolichospermum sp. UKL201]|nr:MAG: oligosaccharide flippase family protein [Dolichospermum sp. UKL201]